MAMKNRAVSGYHPVGGILLEPVLPAVPESDTWVGGQEPTAEGGRAAGDMGELDSVDVL